MYFLVNLYIFLNAQVYMWIRFQVKKYLVLVMQALLQDCCLLVCMLRIEQEYLIYKVPALCCTSEVVVLRAETSSGPAPSSRNPTLKPLLKGPQVPSLRVRRQTSIISTGPCACQGHAWASAFAGPRLAHKPLHWYWRFGNQLACANQTEILRWKELAMVRGYFSLLCYCGSQVLW